MPRQLRPDFAGALHHVYSRGNRRQHIAEEPLDYRFLFWLVEQAVARFKWEVHAYCVMPNHYHFLIETPEGGLSRGMQLINGRYAQAFNAGRRLDGHLFQGRFGSRLVESEGHAIWVNRYIARNPVEARLVASPARLRAELAGARPGATAVRRGRTGGHRIRAAHLGRGRTRSAGRVRGLTPDTAQSAIGAVG